jgi:hypothetical protein
MMKTSKKDDEDKRAPYVEQEMFALPEHLSSPRLLDRFVLLDL